MAVNSNATSRYAGAAARRRIRTTAAHVPSRATLVTIASHSAIKPGPSHFAYIAAMETLSWFVRLGSVELATVFHHATSRSKLPWSPYAIAGAASATTRTVAQAAAARNCFVATR